MRRLLLTAGLALALGASASAMYRSWLDGDVVVEVVTDIPAGALEVQWLSHGGELVAAVRTANGWTLRRYTGARDMGSVPYYPGRIEPGPYAGVTSSVQACPGLAPGPGWVCQRGGWLPPGHPGIR